MSYCRFSSDDFRCDVYCYEHVNGHFVTQVAESRVKFKEDLPPDVEYKSGRIGAFIGEFNARHHIVMRMAREAERVSIGLPHDGETFTDPDAGSCADRLQSLKDMGYNVPQDAIDTLREDAIENEGAQK